MKFYLTLILFVAMQSISAQIIKPKEVAKRKATVRTNNAIDRSIDKGLDKVEEGIGNIFKKKDKPEKESNSKKSEENDSEENEDVKASDGSESNEKKEIKKEQTAPAQKASMKAYSKFDFVPGEKVLGFDDFNETSVGDFPLEWNTNSSAEIVTFNDSPEKWLFMSQDGFFQPDFMKDMPENFTLEYDIFTRYRSNNLLNYNFYIYASPNPKADFTEKNIINGFYFDWSGGKEYAGFQVYEKGEVVNKNDNLIIKSLICGGESFEEASKVHFSIWRQKSRLRLYVNEVKVLDIPKAFDPKLKYNAFKLGSSYMNYSEQENKDEYMVANIRYAVGAPDTRSKLITEGKLVTRGILFDVNSDKIKPESYGVLKEIGTVLKENPDVKVKIIGHTDSDGDDTKNLDLSKRRAASVKNALSTEFGIEAGRLETDGKGESQPSEPNTSPQGKANNRRVEFVKL
ncbi:MAG: OmpA family protein [Cytophagaceae bacterium]|nr:OmpA family protein [Cytophagaceae bacterium]MBL0301262.1 OmpA family protein [Cytophagaceae bacterium]MBL0324079.1 OmpA family protein [Cytophagaceae bacterium]